MKRISVILLVLTMLCQIACLSSCQKEKGCNVRNPKKDLPWLKEIIETYEKKAEKDMAEYGKCQGLKIYQCTYNGGVCFWLETLNSNVPISGYSIVDCEGTHICSVSFGGVVGITDTCKELNIKKKKNIYFKREKS